MTGGGAEPSASEREQVVLVDSDDTELGTVGKLAAHRPPGQLHRAFSVFLFDDRGDLLLQRRASGKHHFADRWSNACCSHPSPGEGVLDAAVRRCREELGVAVADAVAVGSFLYRAQDPVSGLVEHELDHVVSARVAGPVELNPAEASACRWIAPAELRAWLATGRAPVTPWLPLAFDVVERAGRPTRGAV
ncbi:MAG: isopentenyl-diphosphate Delta-isomerase [Acidimicrobiales bacterium]